MKVFRFSIIASIAILASASVAAAQTPPPSRGRSTLSILFGVIHANAVAFEPNSSDLVGLTAPALYVNVDVPLRKRLALNLNFGGITTTSTAADLTGAGTIDTRTL